MVTSILAPGLAETGNFGRDHHRRDVLGLELGRVHAHAHLVQHVAHGPDGEGRALFVPGAGESHHQAVAHQLVVAYASEGGHVLEPHTLGGVGLEQPAEPHGRQEKGHEDQLERSGLKCIALGGWP